MAVNGQFHSVVTSALPTTGIVGDVWYTTDTKLIYMVVGDGTLRQLLEAVPIPVKGDPGPKGDTGAPGPLSIIPLRFRGEWLADSQYELGDICLFEDEPRVFNSESWVPLGY